MTALQPAMFPGIESPDFTRSEEVADVADEVLRRFGRGENGVDRLYKVARAIEREEIRVLWLFNTKPVDRLTEREEHDTAGKCVKAPRLWHDVTGFDVAIWLREGYWVNWMQPEREAAVLHELLHVEIEFDKDDQPQVRIRKHDVEDFVDVVRQYGPLFGEAAAYVRAATVKPAAREDAS